MNKFFKPILRTIVLFLLNIAITFSIRSRVLQILLKYLTIWKIELRKLILMSISSQ